MKTSYIAFFALLLSVSVKSEYIFIDISREDLTPDEETYKMIYTINNRYQWPMSIAYLRKAQKENLAGEINTLKEAMEPGGPHEMRVINRELQAYNPSLRAVFIPTTIYELIALHRDSLVKSEKTIITKLFENHTKMLKTDDLQDKTNIIDFLNQVNNNEASRKISYIINSQCINDVIKAPFLNTSRDNWWKQDNGWGNPYTIDMFLTEFSKEFEPHIIVLKGYYQTTGKELDRPLLKGLQNLSHLLKQQSFRADLRNIIQKEYKAYVTNEALLYRGTQPISIYAGTSIITPLEVLFEIIKFNQEEEEYEPITPEYVEFFHKHIREKRKTNKLFRKRIQKISPEYSLKSLSYGNSLFAGFFNDPTACTFEIFFNNDDNQEQINYLLPISKYDYCFNESSDLSSLFTIAPCSTPLSLYAQGEVFHSRSLSYSFKPQHAGFVVGIDIGIDNLAHELEYFIREGSPFYFGALISSYLAQNAIILHHPCDLKKESLLADQLEFSRISKAYQTLHKHADKFKNFAPASRSSRLRRRVL